ncbi:hypothetical protein BD414DRAFT_435874 [Trametes punicea]|nr:hypothetical protein BD414DRAFT_435874 [Trametes punicea]
MRVFFRGVSAEVVPYLEQGFLFDWTGDQSPPVPTAAQCDTLHITWGRRSATGPNPIAPYFLQIYTSTFIVPFTIQAGDEKALSYDWVVPFIPGTQFQMCMVASNGVTGGCQNIWTVYQRPNTTLNNPPTCFNLTYPQAPLGVDAAFADGTWSQYGWVDQCTDISLKPTNGTPPYTYSILPALHPPFNITSDTMDPVNWTVSLMYGIPFWVSVSDANGVGWTNGPLHPTGGGSTKCLDLDAALNPQPIPKSSSLSTGATVGIAIGTAIAGALIGLLGALWLHRRQDRRRRSSFPRALDDRRKFSDPGDIPSLIAQPFLSASTTLAGRTGSSDVGDGGGEFLNEHGQVQMVSVSGPSAASHPQFPPTHQHHHSSNTGTFMSPLDSRPPSSTTREPVGTTLRQGSGSHVYVVHHDAGRPPPVTLFTSDGTQVVELPPQYEQARSSTGADQQGAQGMQPGQSSRIQGPRPLPLSQEGQRRTPRSLPRKQQMVATNADQSRPSSS